MAKAAQRQQLVNVEGISGLFATKTGAETTSDVEKVWDGGTDRPDSLPGPAMTSDLVVSRPWDPARDAPIAKRLRKKVGRWTTTVTDAHTDRDLVPIDGAEEVFSEALLVGVSVPDHDASSGSAGAMTLTFSVDQVD